MIVLLCVPLSDADSLLSFFLLSLYSLEKEAALLIWVSIVAM